MCVDLGPMSVDVGQNFVDAGPSLADSGQTLGKSQTKLCRRVTIRPEVYGPKLARTRAQWGPRSAKLDRRGAKSGPNSANAATKLTELDQHWHLAFFARRRCPRNQFWLRRRPISSSQSRSKSWPGPGRIGRRRAGTGRLRAKCVQLGENALDSGGIFDQCRCGALASYRANVLDQYRPGALD